MRVATENMPLALAIQTLSLVLAIRSAQEQVAAENINLAPANPNIFILHQIVLLLVLFPAHLVMENILAVFVQTVLVRELMAAKLTILLLVPPFAKKLIQIIAATELPSQRLMAVLNIGLTVLQNAKQPIMTIVGIVLP